MPEKKECKNPLVLYGIYAILGFLIGQRGALVYRAIFILAYLIYRNSTDATKEKWISKKMIRYIIISLPLLIVALQLYGYIREGRKMEFSSVGPSIIDFFSSIGNSSKVIKAGYDYRASFKVFKFYSLGDTLNYFKYSKLFYLFNGGNALKTQTISYALNSHSFDSIISYLIMKRDYLAGHGAGSSYIACLFADFGYIGIIIGSFLYGILFKIISNLDKQRWIATAMKLYSFLFLIKAPRGSYDCFIGAIVNVTFWFTILVIYVISDSKFKKNRTNFQT